MSLNDKFKATETSLFQPCYLDKLPILTFFLITLEKYLRAIAMSVFLLLGLCSNNSLIIVILADGHDEHIPGSRGGHQQQHSSNSNVLLLQSQGIWGEFLFPASGKVPHSKTGLPISE